MVDAVYDQKLDQHIRKLANCAVENLNRQEFASARHALSTTLEILRSLETPLFGGGSILLTLWKVADALDERVIKISLDTMMSAMMGDGIIEYDFDSRSDLLTWMTKLKKKLEATNPSINSQELENTIILFVDGRDWHIDERKHLKTLSKIAHKNEMLSLSLKIEQLLGQLDVQAGKLDLFSEGQRAKYLTSIDYPLVVTIETYMKCNARCTFCPYPELEDQGVRAGIKMPEELFRKIVNDIKCIPSHLGVTINLSRVNEPLLDSRIYKFIKILNDELPGCSVWLPSNGSTLTDGNIRKLAAIECFKELGISINSSDPEEYERIMGLPFERTLRNVDHLHALLEAGVVPFSVRLTHVTAPGPEVKKMESWILNRWPLFRSVPYVPTDWLGNTTNKVPDILAPVTPCTDWYQVHILADGQEALCCFDSLGEYATGNAKHDHILDMYNVSWQRKARKFLSIRQSTEVPEICHECPIR